MFINDVNKKEEIRNIAIQHLKKYGIKYRPKKSRPPPPATRYGKKFFKVPLQNLETETVTLPNGQQLIIPKRIHEMCSYILSKVQTEGIFRKEGSKSRQNEIKLLLDRGCLISNEHHVIDVAVVLKSFLRELPEPLIPQGFHELFLRYSIAENRLESILLACLLLPCENLNVLSYLMQFFYEVASFSTCNKMSFTNLSILVGPNIFPIDEKMVPKSSLMITKICDITKLLIENSRRIGVIPDNIIEEVGQLSDIEQEKRRKNKRRSGSLTRMLNGLKKIVSSKTEEDPNLPTPDLLITPTIHNSVRKKKTDGLSLKKKKEVITKLPECALLNTPFTPSKTPVSVNPNGTKNNENSFERDSDMGNQKEKKMQWYMRSRSMKSLKEEESTTSDKSNNRRNSLGPKALLERRWSAVSNAANFRKKKRTSCAATKKELILAENKIDKKPEPDYVRVSKTEYEEIKNRVYEIERRISIELDNVKSHIDSDNDNNVNTELNHQLDNNIENVQTAYKKTLESASLSPTTDQLAKRLSRDLRIRRSAEQKIIRSPSARKINTLRRRSTEKEKKSVQITRNQSWHVVPNLRTATTAPLLPRVSLKRKKGFSKENNVVNVNVLAHSQATQPQQTNLQRSISYPKSSSGKKIKTSLPRVESSPCTFMVESSFVHSSPRCALAIRLSDSGMSQITSNTSGASSDHWTSAEGFFNDMKTPVDTSSNARASVAKLRCQNAGMVRAKARLFDNLKDSDTSSSSIRSSTRSHPGSAKKQFGSSKSGSARSNDSSRMSYRVRALRIEEKKKKCSISPRRRNVNTGNKQRLQQVGKQYVKFTKEVNSSMDSSQDILEISTPRRDLNSPGTGLSPRKNHVPYIKAPLTVKTPKRLCRTPGVDKKTPLRVIVKHT